MALHLILLGPPASGKGTQGRRLAADRGLDYLSTGALLRGVLREDSEASREIRPILDRGGYIPDELMCGIMRGWLAAHPDGWVLDGFPRTLMQDDFLAAWLAERGERVDAAIALDVPKDELIRRIEGRVECPDCRWSGQKEELDAGGLCPKCGGTAGPRADDNLTNFLSRYDEYCEQTVPVIERHDAAGTLLHCDATRSVDTVAATIEANLKTLTNDGETA